MKRAIGSAVLALTLACAGGPRPVKAVAVGRPLPTRSVGELQAALSSPSADERRAAAWDLAGVKEPGTEVRQALARMRDSDPDPQARLAAVWALGHISPLAGPHGPIVDTGYDTPPRLVKQTRPIYPAHAYTNKISGTVDVEILIDEEGGVAHAEVRQSIPELDTAATQTVLAWKFAPAMKGGRPVPTLAIAPVTFRIY